MDTKEMHEKVGKIDERTLAMQGQIGRIEKKVDRMVGPVYQFRWFMGIMSGIVVGIILYLVTG